MLILIVRVILLLVIESYLIKFSFCKPSKSYSYGEHSDKIYSILFQEKYENHRMVEIIFTRELNSQNMIDCFLYGDKELADNAISKRPRPPQVRYVSSKKLSYWVNKCSQLLIEKIQNGKIQNYYDKHSLQENYYDKDFHEDNYYDQDFPQEFNNEIDRNFFDGLMIFPGTKWCGAGTIAKDYDDLGSEVKTDLCCRHHDYCFDNILKGETKYNLTNESKHTKSNCYCDQEFQSCLRSVNSKTSTSVAKLYFNLIQVQCFKKDHPIVKCLKYKGIPLFWKSCQKYKLDFKKAMIYQFFDSKFF